MLQRIHERVSGWFAWAIIILIAITFTLFGVSYYLGSKAGSQVKAEVNDAVITKEQFDLAYRRLKRQQDVITVDAEKRLKAQALQQLVMDNVILQALSTFGFHVSREQAESAILAIPQFLEDGKFSNEKFQQTLSSNLYTPQRFLKKVEQGMLINQQRFMFTASSFVLPSELDRFIKLVDQKRDYRYLSIENDALYPLIKVTDKELNDFYQANQKAFMTKEKVSVSYVSLSMKQIRDSIKPTKNELLAFYEDNKASYVKPAKYLIAHILISVSQNADAASVEKAQKALAKVKLALKSGKSFAEVAKLYSSDLLSPQGLLPWMTAGTLGQNFAKTLVRLKVGEVSEPIRTKDGFEIIRLVKKKDKKVLPFNTVKNELKIALVGERAQTEFAHKNEELTDLTYQNPESLEVASKQLGLTIQTTPLFTRQGLKKGIASKKAVIQAAFSSDVLNQGDNSQPIQVSEDAIVVLRKKEHLASTLQPFKVVEKEVKRKVLFNKAQALSKQLGINIAKNLNESKNPADMIKKYQLKWVDEKNVRRNQTTVPFSINRFVFSLPSPKAKPIVKGKPMANGYVVVELKGVKQGSLNSVTKDQKKLIGKQLAQTYGIKDYNTFIQGLMKKAKVVIK